MTSPFPQFKDSTALKLSKEPAGFSSGSAGSSIAGSGGAENAAENESQIRHNTLNLHENVVDFKSNLEPEMTEIPDDIFKAAEFALDKLLCNCVESCGGEIGAVRRASINDIAEAICAERKRCAKIADVEAHYGIGCNPVELGRRIADLIRGEA